MSEFECANGHVCPSKGCKCGARIVKMDGLSSREWKKREEYENRIEKEEEDD